MLQIDIHINLTVIQPLSIIYKIVEDLKSKRYANMIRVIIC